MVASTGKVAQNCHSVKCLTIRFTSIFWSLILYFVLNSGMTSYSEAKALLGTDP